MVALVNEGRDGLWETLVTIDMIRDEWSDPRLDLAHDTWVATSEAGEYIAVAEVWFEDNPPAEDRVYRHIGFTMHPSYRESQRELMEHLFTTALDHALARPLVDPSKQYYLKAWASANDEWKHAWLLQHGFEQIHIGCTMLRDKLDPLPGVPPLQGVRIERWSQERDRTLWQALNEGFSSEETFTPLTWQEWRDIYHSERMDPSLWYLAVTEEGGQIVGFAISEIDHESNQISGRRDGWITDLTVLEGWRNQGIGTNLLLRAIETLKEAGMSAVKVGVDSTEPHIATQLYESLGFHIIQGSCTYRRPIS